MSGTKGRSGGRNKKSLREHLEAGSYRRARHGAIPAELQNLKDMGRGRVAPFKVPDTSKAPDEPAKAEGAGQPSPPDWLPPAACKRWAELAPAVHRAGRLTETDIPAFAALCIALAELAWAGKQRQRFAAKGEKLHGLNAHRQRCIATVRAMAVEFGLTPASRCRVEELVPVVPPERPRLVSSDGKPVLDRLGNPA